MFIARWNGPVGNFTSLAERRGARYGVKDGDVIRATITGNMIRAYKNGVCVAAVADNTYTSGNPGMGFDVGNSGGPKRKTDFGFSTYTASAGVRVAGDHRELCN